jgi:hypothetical protein
VEEGVDFLFELLVLGDHAFGFHVESDGRVDVSSFLERFGFEDVISCGSCLGTWREHSQQTGSQRQHCLIPLDTLTAQTPHTESRQRQSFMRAEVCVCVYVCVCVRARACVCV